VSGSVSRSYTSSRRRPSEIGRLPGLNLPWPFTLTQFGVGACGIAVCVAMLWVGLPGWLLPAPVAATLLMGRAVRRTRIDSRHLLPGLAGRVRFRARRDNRRRLADRTADAVVSNAVVGADHSVWIVLAVTPAHYGMLADRETLRGSLAAAEQLVASISTKRWRLMSTLETVTSQEVARRMVATSPAASWSEEIAAEQRRLSTVTLTERRFWLWLDVGDVSAPAGWAGAVARLRRLAGWAAPARAAWLDTTATEAATTAAVSRASAALSLRPATADEVQALLGRVATGVCSPPRPEPEADYRHLQPAAVDDAVLVGSPSRSDGATVWRRGDALWCEPAPRMALAETPTGDVVAHVSAMVAHLPDAWQVPGGGELLWRLDSLADPWEWVLDATTVPHAEAVAKTNNQASRLRNQYDQYAGTASGTPPDLDMAVDQVETQRLALAGRSDSDEYVVTVALCSSVDVTGALDAGEILAGRLQRLQGLASAVGVTVAAPTGDQVAARRMWMPLRATRCPAVRDYRQYLLSDGVAGIGPCLHARLGDPQGAVLGMIDEHGPLTPVLFDPTLGPRAASVGGSPRSPSIGIAGALGRGKSVFSKRVLWTTLAAGGAVVVVDRSEMGEYAAVARAISQVAPGITVEVIDVTDAQGGSIDPMRAGLGVRAAADTAVRLLCFTAGLDPRSPVAAEVARTAAAAPGVAMVDVVKQAAGASKADSAEWRPLTSLVEVLADDPTGGSLFDPHRPPANLRADLVVLHAPGLALTDTPETPADVAATAVVLGTMLVARALIFADPARFAGLLLDEAWALLPDGRARQVVTEALRDGRKHNAGVWLATQSPQDFAISPELSQLLGSVALFGVTTEDAARAGAELAGLDPELAAPTLMTLPTGVMLWRDVLGRTGLVEVWLPADPRAAVAVETTPHLATAVEAIPA